MQEAIQSDFEAANSDIMLWGYPMQGMLAQGLQSEVGERLLLPLQVQEAGHGELEAS